MIDIVAALRLLTALPLTNSPAIADLAAAILGMTT